MAMTTAVNGFSHGGHFTEDDGPHFQQEFISSQEFRDGVEQIVAERLGYSQSAAPSSQQSHQNAVGPVAPISDIRGADTLNYRKGEKVLRCKLAACYRLANIYGWDNGGLRCSITGRLGKDVDQFLINPDGILSDEITAANLIKVDLNSQIVDNGCTSRGVARDSVALNAALYAGRMDANCSIFISNSAAVSISVMKCGLLPLCHESMVIGKVSYADYIGGLEETNNCRHLLSSFEPDSKVLFLRNFGVLIAGETVEETFHISNNVMTAVDTQISLIPVGLQNIHLPSNETLSTVTRLEHDLPPGVNPSKKWLYGEVEFEALMRQLDNAGYCTGYVYQETASRQRTLRSQSTTEVTAASMSVSSDDRDVTSPLSKVLMQKRTARPELIVTPNVYHREDSKEQNATKWVTDATNSGSLSKPRSASMKAINANKFAPQGSNPKELRQKVKEIRKEYFEDTITAGPQSTILEGVTWEEAQRIKAGQVVGGVDNVLVTSASRGIIQRDHQPKALFYKNYQMGNPFDNITDKELEQYKKEVEKKSKRGIESSYFSETEMDRRNEWKDSTLDQGRKSVDSELYLRDAKPTVTAVPTVRTPPVKETNVDDLSPSTLIQNDPKPVLTTQSQPKAVEPAPQKKKEQLQEMSESEKEQLQRTQSARYSDRASELKKEQKSFSLKSGSFRLTKKSVPAKEESPEGTLDNRSSKENSPSREGSLTKDKKKKRGFRFPSFSKKKDKQ